MPSANTDNPKPVKRKTDTDWNKLRLEYINSTLSLRDLAEKHKVNDAGVMKRAAKEKWEQERQRRSAEVSAAAQEKITEQAVDRLAEFSAKDIELAELFKSKITNILANIDDEKADGVFLNTLANALSTAQKVGRLALGAETANTKTTGKMDVNVAQPEDITGILAEMEQMASKATIQ